MQCLTIRVSIFIIPDGNVLASLLIFERHQLKYAESEKGIIAIKHFTISTNDQMSNKFYHSNLYNKETIDVIFKSMLYYHYIKDGRNQQELI